MIDKIKRWLDGESIVVNHQTRIWLRWCVAEIERLTPPRCTCDDFCDDPCPVHRWENDLQNRALLAEEQVRNLELLLAQRCETCGHWQPGELRVQGRCRFDGPPWMQLNGNAMVLTEPKGGAGCDNYVRRET